MTVKLIICGRRRPGQTLAEHRAHMKDRHGKLVLDYVAQQPSQAPRRYIQNHAFDGVYFDGEELPKAFATGLDFVTEVYFPDLAAVKSSRETPFYLEKLQPDEPEMVDGATVVGIPAAEQLVMPPEPRDGAVKVFVAWFSKMPGAGVFPVATDPAALGLLGYCRNTPLFPGPLVAIDEYWLADDAAGVAFAHHCRDAILGPVRSDAPSFCITIAREYVLHAGHADAGQERNVHEHPRS